MELPAALRQAVDRLLEHTPLSDLQRAAEILSGRYRAEIRDGRMHLDDTLAVKAYLATRLPATYAAIRSSIAMAAEMQPDFEPQSLLDLGAGPGSALWAASDCWQSIGRAELVETSAAARTVGQTLSAQSSCADISWHQGDVTRHLPAVKPAELTTICYVLDEIAPDTIGPLVDRLWALTTGMLIVVEPGTPAGWQRITLARDRLIAAGAAIVAPCPHAAPCPIISPDWCHFSRRVARSRVHRLAKGGEVPWEDEKFTFIAASRNPGETYAARVIAPARGSKGMATLKLCSADSTAAERTFTKREGDMFRVARRLDWGDAFESAT